MQEKTIELAIDNNKAILKEEVTISKNEITPIPTMKYEEFLKQLSKLLHINLKTLHQCFVETKIEVNKYLNQSTIRLLKQKFDNYLMYNAMDKFSIEYQKITNTIHPTKLTNADGKVKDEIDTSSVGILHSDEKVADNYFFNELFYDSELEKENIKLLL